MSRESRVSKRCGDIDVCAMELPCPGEEQAASQLFNDSQLTTHDSRLINR